MLWNRVCLPSEVYSQYSNACGNRIIHSHPELPSFSSSYFCNENTKRCVDGLTGMRKRWGWSKKQACSFILIIIILSEVNPFLHNPPKPLAYILTQILDSSGLITQWITLKFLQITKCVSISNTGSHCTKNNMQFEILGMHKRAEM